MATQTSKLKLRKPEYADLIDEATDLNANYDKVDAEMHNGYSGSLPSGGSNLYNGRFHHLPGVGQWVLQGGFWKSMSLPAMSGTSDAAIVPTANLLAFDDTNGLISRYVSGAWQGVTPVGIVLNEAKYQKSSPQTIAASTVTELAFESARYTSPDVTPNGGRTQFTIGRAGLWRVSAGARLDGTSEGSLRYIRIARVDGTPEYYAACIRDSEQRDTFNCRTTVRLPVGAVMSTQMQHNASSSRSITTDYYSYTFMSFAWLRP